MRAHRLLVAIVLAVSGALVLPPTVRAQTANQNLRSAEGQPAAVSPSQLEANFNTQVARKNYSGALVVAHTLAARYPDSEEAKRVGSQRGRIERKVRVTTHMGESAVHADPFAARTSNREGSPPTRSPVFVLLPIALIAGGIAWIIRRRKKRELLPSGSPMTSNAAVQVITYKGSQQKAMEKFQAHAGEMAARGYMPTSQSWAQGSWSAGAFILAALLIVVVVGLFVFIYMLLVKPAGTLTVTYQLREQQGGPTVTTAAEKTCPRCAERVKAAAAVCRFCGHEFGSQ